MSYDKYPSELERSEHVGALSAELFSPVASDEAKESLLSILGFYSAYIVPSSALDEKRKKWNEKNDPLNTYYWNSFGYRDKEFVGPVDLIAAGCSQTVGQGVPVETRWSNQLAQKLNMSVATTAVAGWSVQTAINAVMHYISTYGKPKIVALLLPDLFRYDLLLNSEALQSDWISSLSEDGSNSTRRTIEKSGAVRDMPKFSKRPHRSKNIIPTEFSYFINGQTLRFFIEYCKEAGIELVWGTWQKSTHEFIDYCSKIKLDDSRMLIQSPKLDLSAYVNIEYFHDPNPDFDFTLRLKEFGCHGGLKEKYEQFFDVATDSDGHMGVHSHAHIADKFYETLKRNEHEK